MRDGRHQPVRLRKVKLNHRECYPLRSRSRKSLWKKGESSGNIQEVKELRIDCDADCVLAKVRQIGDAACHTGYRSCFYRVVENGTERTDGVLVFDPAKVYGEKK
ncbi:MAG TPA: phosphoribosyl-AMP cyclohydrolase [Spirochaetia bacterium]|nr:phosphoribosyl-AMP cyclohydrolase [Spirochaetia bacterium]